MCPPEVLKCILKFLLFLDSGKLEYIQEKMLKAVSRSGALLLQETVPGAVLH